MTKFSLLGPVLPASEEGEEVVDEYTNEDDNGEEDEDESGADTGDDENEVDGRPEAEEETSEPEGNEEESLRGKHCVIEWEKRWFNG